MIFLYLLKNPRRSPKVPAGALALPEACIRCVRHSRQLLIQAWIDDSFVIFDWFFTQRLFSSLTVLAISGTTCRGPRRGLFNFRPAIWYRAYHPLVWTCKGLPSRQNATTGPVICLAAGAVSKFRRSILQSLFFEDHGNSFLDIWEDLSLLISHATWSVCHELLGCYQ